MTGVTATTEATLCRIFADVLGLALVRPEETFFDLGGDSVLALAVVARAREAGLALSVRDLFDHQAPEALAPVTVQLTDQASASDPAAPAEPPLLTFAGDELDEFEDTEIGQQPSGAEAEWETIT